MNYTIERAAFEHQHAAIWGRHEWPAGALVAVCSQPGGPDKEERGTFRTEGFAPANDVNALWALISGPASRGHNTWLSVAGYAAHLASSTGRGKRADIVGLPAVVVDIDLRSGQHAAGDRNPTESDARRWIALAPAPTVTIRSGGGFHLYYVLDGLLDVDSAVTIELLNRHKHFWVSTAASDELNIDAGVLADVSRVLRPAGTWNSNQAASVVLEQANGPVYSPQQLIDLLPALPDSSSPKKAQKAPTARPVTVTSEATRNRIGDAFAAAVPVSLFAQDVLDARIDGDSVTFPRHDGSHAADPNARVYADSDCERITIFGDRVQRALELEGVKTLSSFDLLARCVGGYRDAARLAGATEKAGQWSAEVYTLARNAMKRSVASSFGIRSDQDEDDGEGISHAGSAATPSTVAFEQDLALDPKMTITEAADTRTAARFDMPDGNVAFLWSEQNGKPLHGIYTVTKVAVEGQPEETRTVYTRIIPWVAWRPSKTVRYTVDDKGRRVESDIPATAIRVALPNGVVRTKDGLTVAEAHNPQTIVDLLDAGLILPTSNAGKAHVRNALVALGAMGTGTEEFEEYGSLGWVHDEGGFTFLAPAGSVNATGVVHKFTVGPPPRSESGSLTPTQEAIGAPDLPSTPEAHRTAAEAVPAFLAITPTKPAAFAVLGMALAAPLALPSRGTVFLAALPQVGKSKVVACLQAFLTGDPWGLGWTGGDIGSAKPVGAKVLSAWARHTLSIWDDFRVPTDDPKAAAEMKSVTTGVLQAAYAGADSGRKGTAGGGIRAIKVAETAAVITGEALPETEGTLSRAISVQLEKGDVANEPKGACALDTFRMNHAADAHRIYWSYIRWLAARADRAGSLAAFRLENERLRTTVTPAGGREAEIASTVAVGWKMFRLFATEHGFADLLPTETYAKETLNDLAGQAAENTAEVNPARGIIRAIRDLIASGDASVELHDDRTPTGKIAGRLGWRFANRHDFGAGEAGEWRASNHIAGTLTADGSHVIVNSATVTRVKQRPQWGAIPDAQVKAGFTAIVKPGTVPGDRAPRNIDERRRRGYIIPAELLDLDNLDLSRSKPKPDHRPF